MFGGVICVYLWSITDYVDGNIARFKKTTSRYGKFLDDFGGELIEVGTFLTIGLGLYRVPPTDALDPGVYLTAGSLAALARMLTSALYLKFHEIFPPSPASAEGPSDATQSKAWSRPVWIQRNATSASGILLPFLLIASVVGRLDSFVLFYGAVSVANFLLILAFLTRKASTHS